MAPTAKEMAEAKAATAATEAGEKAEKAGVAAEEAAAVAEEAGADPAVEPAAANAAAAAATKAKEEAGKAAEAEEAAGEAAAAAAEAANTKGAQRAEGEARKALEETEQAVNEAVTAADNAFEAVGRERGEGAAAGETEEKEPSPGNANLPSSKLLEPTNPNPVQLSRTFGPKTADEILWDVIKDRTEAVQFNFYKEFMDRVLLSAHGKAERDAAERHGDSGALERIVDRVNAYEVLTTATELFMMAECGLVPEEAELRRKLKHIERAQAGPPTSLSRRQLAYKDDVGQLKQNYLAALASQPAAKVLPYYSLIIERLEDLPNKPELVAGGAYNYGILREAATNPPMIELIWSYWHEQGMLMQTMAAIATRFENRRIGPSDALANLNLDPLRGANNLIWGWIQQEVSRLTVRRRAYEYDHQYGLSLFGKAVPRIDAADSRSKFLRCFHELLGLCVKFYEADDDTTVVADPFPVLNALKEVHMVLAEGAHNQFGDLPWTSRVEMMIIQWILARPEFREFLGGRTMVPYEEPWMDRVDSMRQLQGWGDTSVSQFRDLGVYGEQILLSIRYGNWMTNSTVARAANWARTWREHIQVYIHAYRTVTGVDLTAEPVDARAAQARFLQPSAYLRQQEAARARRGLPVGARRS
ncbi:MAG TPA: hypothetical protein VGX72_04070 [Solirubrobacteraceae bacterium]|nr:hypothetical protein [Solirubrobacteraceae bacterium]